MSYHRLNGYGQTEAPPPSILIMPMIALFSVGLFTYLFRDDVFGKKRPTYARNTRNTRKAA